MDDDSVAGVVGVGDVAGRGGAARVRQGDAEVGQSSALWSAAFELKRKYESVVLSSVVNQNTMLLGVKFKK